MRQRMEMSAFEDNPFADEEDDETTSYVEATSRKRGREEAATEEPRREGASQEGEGSRQLNIATGNIPTMTTVAVKDLDVGGDVVQLEKELLAEINADASGSLVPSVEDLLTGYDERQEEDEFNALVVKAAGLESEVKQKEKLRSEELDHMSRSNRELRETVEQLRGNFFRIHEEIDSFRRVQSAVVEECNKSHGIMELLGDPQRHNGALEQTVTDLTVRLLAEDCEGIIPASIRDRFLSCIVGAPNDPLDLAAFDAEAERKCLVLCEEAMERLRTGEMPSMILPIVEALMTMLREIVVRYETLYKSTRALQDFVAFKTSSLRELARESLEWYARSAGRALVGSSGALGAVPAETQEGALGNQHLEATLHHLECVLHQLLRVPNAITLSKQHAPSVTAASALVYCQELESHTEALGREALRLRKLLATDTTTLQHMSELQATQEASTSETSLPHAFVKSEWLMRLTNELLERISTAGTLWSSLKVPGRKRNAPAVDLQLAFYQKYVVMQEALLRLLCTLNSVLQGKVNIVSVIRQVALRDGDDTAFSLLAEKILQESENDIGDLHGELEHVCTESLRQFEEESSELLNEDGIRAEQSRIRLKDVRKFFAHTVEKLDRLLYGATPASGPIHVPLTDSPPLKPAEANGTPVELSFVPSEDKGEVFVQLASKYHEEELQEEFSSFQRRNSALAERLKWLSTQPSSNAVLQLRSVQKEMDAVRQKLEGYAEQETKWAALQDELTTTRGEISVVQSVTVEMRDKLNDIHEKLHARCGLAPS
ncbi:hypothetical protein MOQ_003215 [Trypanosoma cruzi marinkellei]|uniref:Uncharacterized protein n=1 Tax=Trypanosoma cruzi marinkellei TaxID=85056 RepID=K2NDE4_TRYCR|nr:hypothetical protein MOQ_003215 [Trypanosoma cruzi marinkellei]